MVQVRLISAGAGESIVTSLTPDIERSGVRLTTTFGPVGAIQETFTESEDCLLFITSQQSMDDLAHAGRLDAREISDLGAVATALAVRAADPVPDCSTPEALERLLRTAPALFYPDADRSTAGAHFARVLADVGIEGGGGDRAEYYPRGAAAMRALAASDVEGSLGCTQMTEILQSPGVVPAGPLPAPHDLATVYQCALVRRDDATGSEEARHIFELLTGPATKPLRLSLGLS